MSDEPTLPSTRPPAPPDASDVLAALLQLHDKVDGLAGVAGKCFEQLQRVPVLEARVETLELEVARLRKRVGGDTEPAPAPAS